MKIVTPETWYVLFWAGLTVAVCLFCWFAGPSIIARGIVLARKLTG